jgi:hypothetical protein
MPKDSDRMIDPQIRTMRALRVMVGQSVSKKD